MAGDAVVKWVPNKLAAAQIKEIIFEETKKGFEIDAKSEAVRLSPVDTGFNRRSIDTEVKETPKGTEAKIFTQSGYGGYLEIGTRNMPARPYMVPAVRKAIVIIKRKIKLRLKGSK
jgi:HK97 gp10 family phage protein